MADEPLEGFHIVDFAEDTKQVTIALHASILNHKPSRERALEKACEIILKEYGHSVASVVFEPR